MGTRGPSKTPTRLLELRGSWRARTRKGEPKPRRSRPQPPDWLAVEAKEVFVALVRRLWALGVVARVDEGALARYATLFVEYRKAYEFVAKHGSVYVVRGKSGKDGEEGKAAGFKAYPQVTLQIVLGSELLRLEREFGLTPAARARLVTDTPAPVEPAYDYFQTERGSA